MNEGTKPIQNEIEKIEQIAKIQESKIKDNVTKEEVKKLVKLYLKSYDSNKDNEGRLINNTEIYSQLYFR
jgi:DNA-binding protein H-NS